MNPGETVRDVSAPEVRHTFQGTCLGRQGSDCADHVWSTSVIVRDREA
ncbi:jg4245, partial [Pararge aegeria aegeria]